MQANRAMVNQLVSLRAHISSASDSCKACSCALKHTSEAAFLIKSRVLLSRIIMQVKNWSFKCSELLTQNLSFGDLWQFWYALKKKDLISEHLLHVDIKPSHVLFPMKGSMVGTSCLLTGREATEGAPFPFGHSGCGYFHRLRCGLAHSRFWQKVSSDPSGHCLTPSQANVMSMQQPSSQINW